MNVQMEAPPVPFFHCGKMKSIEPLPDRTEFIIL